ncbi:HEAT repeat domain-containing protein [Microcoleus vaginatus]|uniref:HEAT repeat domain-containing protein n=1 Tax=Microcoleus vaginatus TaxID=119532 RepID=UPI001687B1DE|nr:HEAT repeat domain-containing protein [Microcoleus sp. FACHB-84]MBD2010816.1 HEAT repeat domain-containing protein [Microcoleus sp. FACHB-45]
MATRVDFPKYLQSLVESYKKQQHLYTLTDLQVEDRSQPRSPQNELETKIEPLEVLAGLRKYVQQGKVLLVGKPGSGKSTVLQRFRGELAVDALENGARQIPVLVQLRNDRSILEAICAEFRQAKLRVSQKEVDDLLLEGRLLLLLDGVNEMPSQQRRQDLQLFHDKNSHTRMIFTTRDLALGGSLGIEKKLEMCALTQPQMREFVHKHLPQHGDSLLRQLGDRLREVAETPLLLWMLCKVFKPNLKIPQSKGELFQEFDRQYEEFKGVPSVSEDFRRFKPDLLDNLAFVMFQGDSQRPTDGLVAISRRKAEGILKCWLRDRGVLDAPTKAKKWLEDLLEHHMLQVAAKPEEIEFHHQLFQEYYAGRALLKLLGERHIDAINDQRLQHFYLNYFKWTEPLAFMLSLLGDEVQAVRVVGLALEVDLMLGARLAGEVQRQFQKRTVGLVDELDVLGWLKVELLEEARSDDAIPGLLKLLEDLDSYVRWSAADALGKIGDEKAIPGLLKLVEDSDSYGRWSAADALGKIGNEKAIPRLLKLLEDSDDSVRWRVADTLGKIGNEKAIPGLLKLVEDSGDSVRSSVADALGNIGDEQAIPGLLKLVEDSDDSVRSSAADALGKIGNEKVIPGLLKLVEDSDDSVRSSAADALGKIGNEKAIPGLLKLLEDSDSYERSSAADALGKIVDEKAIPGLLKLLEHSDCYVRLMVADALGNIGDEKAIPGLLKLLEDSDYFVRSRAAEALGKIGDEQAIPGLLKLLEHSESSVRSSAADALGNIGDEKAIPGLLKLLPNSDDSVRSSAVDALGNIGDVRGIPGLLKLLKDSNSYERWSAANALGKIGDVRAIPGLLKLLADSDYSVRMSAADALGKIGDIRAIPGLLKLLEDSNYSVRWMASDALGKIGDVRAIPGLLKLLEDSNYYVRSMAADVLGKIGDEQAIPGLLKLLEDSDDSVRSSAADALGNIAKQHAEKVAPHLPHLFTLIPSESGKEFHRLILVLQVACKYYNYPIRHLSLLQESGKHPVNDSASVYSNLSRNLD